MDAELLVRVDDSWNPLEHRAPPPEYVPPSWTSTHVGARLAQAFATLQIATVARRPAGYGNAWPAHSYDWADLLAQRQRTEAELAQDAAARNWTKVIPGAEELARMEVAIGWPARYVGEFPQLVRVVQGVALARSRHLSMRRVAHRLGVPGRIVRRWNGEGLALIAAGLRHDRVAIF